MDSFSEMWPFAVFILIVLASSFYTRSKKRASEDQSQPEIPTIHQPDTPSSGFAGAAAAPERVRRVETGRSRRASVIQPAEQEGGRALSAAKDDSDPYAVKHEHVPAAAAEWRKAIVAYEILKTKF